MGVIMGGTGGDPFGPSMFQDPAKVGFSEETVAAYLGLNSPEDIYKLSRDDVLDASREIKDKASSERLRLVAYSVFGSDSRKWDGITYARREHGGIEGDTRTIRYDKNEFEAMAEEAGIPLAVIGTTLLNLDRKTDGPKETRVKIPEIPKKTYFVNGN